MSASPSHLIGSASDSTISEFRHSAHSDASAISRVLNLTCAGAVSGEVAMAKKPIGVNPLSIRLSIKKGTRCTWCCLRRTPFIKAGRSLRFDAEEVIQWLPHSEKSERV
jgi:hypothetical protein